MGYLKSVCTCLRNWMLCSESDDAKVPASGVKAPTEAKVDSTDATRVSNMSSDDEPSAAVTVCWGLVRGSVIIILWWWSLLWSLLLWSCVVLDNLIQWRGQFVNLRHKPPLAPYSSVLENSLSPMPRASVSEYSSCLDCFFLRLFCRGTPDLRLVALPRPARTRGPGH